MKYPAYPKYKPSGVEWLGEVPEHWEVVPLKHITDFVNGMAFKPEEWSDDGVPIIRIENLNGGDDFNCFEGETPSRYHVIKGDLLFGWSGNRGTSFGPFIWWRNGIHYLNQHIFKLTGFKCDKSWFYWCLKAVTKTIEDEAHGIIGMVHVTKGRLGAVKIPIFQLAEQRAIADFLDRETAKLDTLVAKKRELIEKLKEKRTALISRTVTRGLPPDAARAAGLDPQPKLKPSGIEWLGEVPEHWEVKKVSRIFEVKGRIGWRGYTIDDLRDEDDGVLVLGATHIDRDGSIILDKATYLSREKYEESPEIKLSGGELLIVKVGATIGKVGMVPLWDKEATVNPNVMLLRRGERDNRFFHYQFLGSTVQSMLGLEKMAGAQEAINQEFVSSLRLLVPPPAEQRAIADYLDRETAKIDQMAAKVEEAIARLQEYRTALITAAVTGKIEVRPSAVKEAA